MQRILAEARNPSRAYHSPTGELQETERFLGLQIQVASKQGGASVPGPSHPRLGSLCVAASVNEPFWVSSAWAGLGKH